MQLDFNFMKSRFDTTTKTNLMQFEFNFMKSRVDATLKLN
jgi:hypothetical protein